MSIAPTHDELMPPAVRAERKLPSRASVDAIRPALKKLPATFWTSDFVELVKDQSGFRHSNGISRAQVLLWHQGYRVVEKERYRNGFLYQWRKDPDAPIGEYGIDPESRRMEATVTRIRPAKGSAEEVADQVIERVRQALPPQVEKPVDGVRTEGGPDYDRGLAEGMAMAEEEIAGYQRQLGDASEALALAQAEAQRLRQSMEEQRAEYQRRLGEAIGDLDRTGAELTAARRDATRAMALATPAPVMLPVPDDGSWVLSEQEIGDQSLASVVRGARVYGLDIEVRARRRG